MSRRLLGSVVFALLMAVQGAAAQPPSPVPRIGYIAWKSCGGAPNAPGLGAGAPALARGLADLGYQLGQNLIVECRSAGLSYEGFRAAAAELVELHVALIVDVSEPAARFAAQVTTTVPIVSTISGDPVGSGLARSLARPGGNVTGVTYYNTELTAKRLELLKELVPGLARVGVLANPKAPPLPFEVDTREAASRLGLALSVQGISEPGEFEPAFARMKAEGVQAVFVLPDLLFAVEAQRIADLALANALPTMTWGSWFAQAGCLAAYSADYEKINYRLAFYVDRIIKGEQPANLPIEQASTYYFTLNLRTANALGIKPPRSIMLIADEVLE